MGRSTAAVKMNRQSMASLLLKLSLCIVAVIQMTSSQSTYDVIQQDHDVSSCEATERLQSLLTTTDSQLNRGISRLTSTVSQLASSLSEMQTVMTEMQMTVSELQSNMSQLQREFTDCPSDFTNLSPVNAGCYKLISENLAWTEAGRRCRSLHKDAHLLIINNAVEQSAVRDMLSAVDRSILNRCNRTQAGFIFRTAGQRIDPTSSQSTFVWKIPSRYTSSGETAMAMNYTNWFPGQPDWSPGQQQSCMVIWSGYSYTWDDDNCNYTYCSICEIDI